MMHLGCRWMRPAPNSVARPRQACSGPSYRATRTTRFVQKVLVRQRRIRNPEDALDQPFDRTFLFKLIDHACQAFCTPSLIKPLIGQKVTEYDVYGFVSQNLMSFAAGKVRAQVSEQRFQNINCLSLLSIRESVGDVLPHDDGCRRKLTPRGVVCATEIQNVGNAALKAMQGMHQPDREFGLGAIVLIRND